MKFSSALILIAVISTVLNAAIPPQASNLIVPDYENFRSRGENIVENFYLVVELESYKMFLYKDKELVKEYDIAIGKKPGDKEKVGDKRTPWGNFKIEKIQPASYWEYDFGDGRGPVHAYGKWFIRLETKENQTFSGKKWTGIGIHGTHDEESIGTRASRGCLRMHNNEIEELVDFVKSLPDIHLNVFIRQSIPENEEFTEK